MLKCWNQEEKSSSQFNPVETWKQISPSTGRSRDNLQVFKGTSLAVQWLRLGAFTALGTGSIPGWGTMITHVTVGEGVLLGPQN